MISMKSKLAVADNSGALVVECINVLTKKKKYRQSWRYYYRCNQTCVF
jgi:ribosomal protein L14